jgi:hypothetical protein
MASIKPKALRLRKENYDNYIIKMLVMGVTNYNPPLTHSYRVMAEKDYD